MKTKKSGVRGSVITNADLEKSIKELDGVASGRVKLFGRYDFYEPLAGDGPLARALVPFNKAAAGAALKADDKTLEKFCAMWFGVCQSFDPGPDLRMSFGLVWNGFINAGSVWMCPQVFGGDYGVFRFNLSKAVQWKFYEQCGAQKDCERITKIEDGQKRRDMKIGKALLMASEAESRAKGELTEKDICEKQERYAVRDYISGEPLRETLIRMLKASEINGFKIVGDMGWIGWCMKAGYIARNDCGNIYATTKGIKDLGKSRLYQRVHRALLDCGKWKMKSRRKRA